MNCLRIVSFVALAGKLACGADSVAARDKGSRPETSATETAARPSPPAVPLPQVLKGLEPKDSRIVMLPGPVVLKQAHVPRAVPVLVAPGWRPKGVPVLPVAPDVVLTRPVVKADNLEALASVVPAPPRFPVPDPSPAWSGSDAGGDQALSVDTEVAAGPLSASADGENASIDFVTAPDPGAKTGLTVLPPAPHKPAYLEGLAQESALFCQREMGHWTLTDARAVLGEPQRQRPAIDDDATENGQIYAFRDPTNRYRELELDFGKENGLLRTVFVYPWNLTWQDCRKLWGAKVSATEGIKGRIFYSYVNRHLDVLVDREGKVISLGLY
jgi:hypothetical protein